MGAVLGFFINTEVVVSRSIFKRVFGRWVCFFGSFVGFGGFGSFCL